MFFSRKPKQQAPPEPSDQRQLYRAKVDPEVLRATVTREGHDPVQAGVVDLSLEGAGVEVPFHLDPEFEAGEIVELALRHAQDGWTVVVSARVEQLRSSGGANVHYGMIFLGMGGLYAQLEDILGRYFNRRRDERVQPHLDKDVMARLRQGGHRPRGPIQDLSVSGMCMTVDLVAAAPLKVGENLRVRFELPGCKVEFEGQARLLTRRRLGDKEFVSMEFDLEAGGTLAEHHADLKAYIAGRSEQMAAFSRALAENTLSGS